MVKALLKKQLMELLSGLMKSRKKGKTMSIGGKVGIAVLMIYCFFALGMLFFLIASTLSEPLVNAGLGWFYFALMGLMATGMGVIGSVFSTYSALYAAKDNELLLSLPIQPKYILLARLLGTYLLTVLFEAMVLLPTVIARMMAGGTGALLIPLAVLTLLLLPLLAVVIACLLGWLIALIVPHVHHKSIVGTVLYLVFFALYFWGYSKLNQGLQLLIANADAISGKMKVFAYPFMKLGEGLEGSGIAYLQFVLIAAALFLLVYRILSGSFLKLATTKRGEARREYRETEKETVQRSLDQALLRKEWQRFTRSTAYLLNCGLGMIVMPVAAVFVLLKAEMLRNVFAMAPGLADFGQLLVIGAVMLVCSMDAVTAPSITLEANTLWLLKSLPVEPVRLLKNKLRLHVLVSAPGGILLTLALDYVLGLDVSQIIVSVVSVLLFVECHGLMGLWLNLRYPNLNWSSETAAVKQSASGLLTIFGSWGVIMLLAAGAYFTRDLLQASQYAYGILILLAVAYRFLYSWMTKKASSRFEAL